MRAWIQMLVVAVAGLISLGAMTERPRDAADVGDDIRIGNLMPYTGALSAFAAIGKAEASYFDWVNAQGGVNGRKLRFISHDDNSDPYMETHVSILKRSGADIFVFAGAPAVAAKVIRIAADLNWHPVFILDSAAASIATALKPAGLENSAGVISTSFLKDANDPIWKDDPAVKEWLSFMTEHYASGDRDDSGVVYGYAAAQNMVEVLKRCSDDLSRENIMRQAASLKDYRAPMMLPGITISTDAGNFRPIRQMRLVQFDGRTWQPIGDVIESAFSAGGQK